MGDLYIDIDMRRAVVLLRIGKAARKLRSKDWSATFIIALDYESSNFLNQNNCCHYLCVTTALLYDPIIEMDCHFWIGTSSGPMVVCFGHLADFARSHVGSHLCAHVREQDSPLKETDCTGDTPGPCCRQIMAHGDNFRHFSLRHNN